MPKIDELKIKLHNKKFKKTAYRPWDSVDGKELVLTNQENKNSIILQKTVNDEFLLSNGIDALEKKVRRLCGLQMNIFLYLIRKIYKKDELYSYTSPISYSELIEYTRSPKCSIAVSLTRLKAKEILLSAEIKPGRGGFAMYKISNDLCNYLNQTNF